MLSFDVFALVALLAAASPAPIPLPRPVPGQPKPKPYVPPKLEAEPETVPSEVATVDVPADRELPIVSRPAAGMPMIGAAATGTHLPVKGVYEAPSKRGCASGRWFALDPRGWVCSSWVKPSKSPPTAEPVLKMSEGALVPFNYVMVGFRTDKESLPLWQSIDDVKTAAPPFMQLHKGDTVAVQKTQRIGDANYQVAEDGRVLPARSTFAMKKISEWHGLPLDASTPLPFAWVTFENAAVYDGPGPAAKVVGRAKRRDRLAILREEGEGKARRIEVGEGRWMRPQDLNEVRALPRPATTLGNPQWIDVDVGEQVLVAYEGDTPVFATLVSTGRSMPTPLGDYPIWAKVSHITMKSQPYEDKTYYVDRVPWALFFQAHNAIHGAYWHDVFGVSKSHGCINTAPRDARWLFEWVAPGLPPGWSGTRTPNLLEGVVVHVRHSKRRLAFVQERVIGAPDRELEKLKREEADARRAAEAAEAAGRPPTLDAPSADPR